MEKLKTKKADGGKHTVIERNFAPEGVSGQTDRQRTRDPVGPDRVPEVRRKSRAADMAGELGRGPALKSSHQRTCGGNLGRRENKLMGRCDVRFLFTRKWGVRT